MAIKGASPLVMVVEDHDDARKFLIEFLILEGYRVVEVTNGLEAVDIIGRKCPSAILMDLNMPIMDGLTASEHVQKYRRLFGNKLPVIALTAYHSDGMKEAAIRAGCDAYLTKPLDMRVLKATLEDLISDADSRPSKALRAVD
jgi:two-component system cell cycle response regulator DivK